jgi:hypothetical protein
MDNDVYWYAREQQRGVVNLGRLGKSSRGDWSSLKRDVAFTVESAKEHACRMD